MNGDEQPAWQIQQQIWSDQHSVRMRSGPGVRRRSSGGAMGLFDGANGSIAYQKVADNETDSNNNTGRAEGLVAAAGWRSLLARQGKVVIAFFIAVGVLLFYVASVS